MAATPPTPMWKMRSLLFLLVSARALRERDESPAVRIAPVRRKWRRVTGEGVMWFAGFEGELGKRNCRLKTAKCKLQIAEGARGEVPPAVPSGNRSFARSATSSKGARLGKG